MSNFNPKIQALYQANDFSDLFGREKDSLMALTPSPSELEQQNTIEKSLADALLLLNAALQTSYKLKLKKLKKVKLLQQIVNILHFLTASVFFTLLNKDFALMKWVGAFISLVAGVIAIIIPKNNDETEKKMDEDSEKISKLNGQVVALQLTITIGKNINDQFYEEVIRVIAECKSLATRFDLERLKNENTVLS